MFNNNQNEKTTLSLQDCKYTKKKQFSVMIMPDSKNTFFLVFATYR